MPSYNGGPYYSPKAEVTKIVDGSAVTGVQVEQENEGLRLNFTNEAGDEAFSAHIPAYSGSGSGVLGKNFAQEIESTKSAIDAHALDNQMHLTTAERNKINAITTQSLQDASDMTTSVNQNKSFNQNLSNIPRPNVFSTTQKISDGFGIINTVFKKVFDHMYDSGIHVQESTLGSYCTNDKYNTLKSTVDGHTTSISNLNTNVNKVSSASVKRKAGNKSLTWDVMWASKPVEYSSGKSYYWTVCSTSIPFTGVKFDTTLPGLGYKFYVSNDSGWINWFKESDKEGKWYKYPYTFKAKPIVTVSARCTTDLTAKTYDSLTSPSKFLYWGLPIEAKMMSDGTELYLPSIVLGTPNVVPYTYKSTMTFDLVLDIMVQGWTE